MLSHTLIFSGENLPGFGQKAGMGEGFPPLAQSSDKHTHGTYSEKPYSHIQANEYIFKSFKMRCDDDEVQ